jgi:hypothetical protein
MFIINIIIMCVLLSLTGKHVFVTVIIEAPLLLLPVHAQRLCVLLNLSGS